MRTAWTTLRRAARATLPAVLLAAAATGALGAPRESHGSGPPNALQGFSQNRDQPINIESATLEVHDKEKIAKFIDNVHLTQGDVTLECKLLVVYYDEEVSPVGAGKKPAPKTARSVLPKGGQQQIRKLEAKGGVIVTQKDQIATGDNGVYDMKSNTVVLTGHVTVTQGQNVVTGDKLYVDLTTNVSRVESADGKQTPVRAVFMPQQVKKDEAAGPDAKPALGKHEAKAGSQNSETAQSKARQAPRRPMRLN
jgi:lipopolysaccharide export system protein LptA